MASNVRPLCVLCFMSEENEDTGPLATKDDITAHQNCLLYASGIYCKNSPVFDDLFGFSVEDVKQECRRGKKLWCHACKKKGATAGCEVKRCQRSYHYPCAVQHNAHTLENHRRGVFQLYCKHHRDHPDRRADVSMATTSSAQNGGHQATPGSGSKVRKEVTSSGSKKRRRLCSDDDEEEEGVSLIPPVESDAEDSQQSTDPGVIMDRGAATATPQRTNMSASGGPDGDETDIESGGESESLLPHVASGHQRETNSPGATSLGTHPAVDAPSDAVAPGDTVAPSDAEGCRAAEEFWSLCNEADCTRAIFNQLSAQLTRLGQRIHTHQRTAQDCVVALRVLKALGNSEEIISQLETDMEEKERRLQQRREALRAARGALSTDQH